MNDKELVKIAKEQINSKSYKKAKDNLNDAIIFNPNNPDAYYWLGVVSEKLNEIDGAIKYYEKSLHIKPNDEMTLIKLNSLRYSIKEKKEKEQEKEKENAIKSSKEYYDLAINQIIKGEYIEAKQNLERAIEKNTNYTEAYDTLASLLTEHFEKYEESQKLYEKAIEINPNFALAYKNLAMLLSQKLSDHTKANQLFAKYTELTKTDENEFTKSYSKRVNSIDSFEIRNYYSIKSIEINNLNHKKEVYFLGENGDGKTILLQAIFFAFQQSFIRSYANESLIGEAKQALSANKNLILKAKDNNNVEYDFLDLNFAENIFAYGVHRSRTKGKEDKYGFMTLFSNEIELTHPVTWLQKLDYYESKKDFKSPFPLKNAIEILKNILDENVEIEVSPDGVVFTERGTPLSFEQLSDGYKSVLIWVSDLIVKLSKTQPNAKSSVDFKGVVLIDEIDLHLHPKWAYSIVGKLRTWFPKIQWLITTHNPTITLAAAPDAVFYKLYKGNGEIKISQPYEKLNMTANSLLTSLLWRLDSFTTKDIDRNLISSDDYVYQKIHQAISKRIQEVPNLVDEDIMQMIENELDKLEK